ncbi:MAG TPA: hypothetical protein VMA75_01690 [Candidatus Paceibacterota bacterium]|nr:hypothetical protein [Candidatus Paceibacterota bacterium]
MAIHEEGGSRWGIVLAVVVALIVAVLIFFEFDDALSWMAFNDPFQTNWAAVQLVDGEMLYGHLAGVSGSVLGLKDVYLLDKVTEQEAPQASSTDFTLGGTPTPQAGQALVPVSYTGQLFIERSAVLYFKFVAPGDPALQYLR